MKLRLLMILIVLLSIALAACGSNGSKDEKALSDKVIKLNFSHIVSEESGFHAYASKLAEIVNEKTDGQVQIDIFPNAQLGGEAQSIQAIRNGNQDIALVGTAALTAVATEFLVFDVPYLFNDLNEANTFLQSESGDSLLEGLSEYGIVGLGYHSALERNVFSTKRMETLDDFRGTKVRVVQSNGYISTYEKLGAQPTPMPYGEVYLSLQQGLIEAAEGSADDLVRDKLTEVTSYFSLTKAHYYPVVAIMSEKAWGKLSEEQQQIFREAADEAAKAGIAKYTEDYDYAIKSMREQGMEIVEPDIESFKEATKSLKEKYKANNKDLSQDLLDLLK
ncbi:TRAP transporter substrate-binding protein [Sporosarcina highlanderae]|uniref:TRAP transporter substrate-binding protein n=1 Tax=Sporosarcina highlanderae TaxID=3035916 RepID=A0ABT8JL66_9BACL|nr:TRAP transporter substrate-binding protein [Sporosarcina highlanderae]MDN4605886.1 TRAP transporter substrate-binding protein [Sporosarcina highlanderae]